MPHKRIQFRDVGTIQEPVTQCLQRAADHVKWQAQRDQDTGRVTNDVYNHDHAHSSLVQAQHRVSSAIDELTILIKSTASDVAIRRARHAIALLRGEV